MTEPQIIWTEPPATGPTGQQRYPVDVVSSLGSPQRYHPPTSRCPTEDGGNMLLRSVLPKYQTTRSHNPKDHKKEALTTGIELSSLLPV
jgi:hypothetical protein